MPGAGKGLFTDADIKKTRRSLSTKERFFHGQYARRGLTKEKMVMHSGFPEIMR